jgi:hypothetical protein
VLDQALQALPANLGERREYVDDQSAIAARGGSDHFTDHRNGRRGERGRNTEIRLDISTFSVLGGAGLRRSPKRTNSNEMT